MSSRIGQVYNRLLYKDPRVARVCSVRKKMVKREPITITCEDVALNPKKRKKNLNFLQSKRATHLDIAKYNDHNDTTLARRKHESNLLITMNTNRQYKDADLQEATGAMHAALTALSRDEAICSMLVFGPKNREHYKDDKYDDVIEGIAWKACVEVGDVKKRLHAHIHMTVDHFSQIQVSAPILARMFTKEFNSRVSANNRIVGKPYVNVKLLASTDFSEIVKRYIGKQAIGGTVERQ